MSSKTERPDPWPVFPGKSPGKGYRTVDDLKDYPALPRIPNFRPEPDPQTGRSASCTQILGSATEVLIRPLEQSGFELVLGLDRSLSPETLRRLASETDRVRLIERALSQ